MLSIIRKPHLRRATALLLALVLCLSPLGAIAETYDIGQEGISVTAYEDGRQTVTGTITDGGHVEDNTDHDPVITGTSTGSGANTVTITAEAGATANVTLDGLTIDASADNDAAVKTDGQGNVVIELDGENSLTGGHSYAGLEKGNDGNLTIQDEHDDGDDKPDSLIAQGGYNGAGIGGGDDGAGSDITITGGTIEATGGANGAGIGGGDGGDGTGITIEDGTVAAIGGKCGAGIGGGSTTNGGGNGVGDDIEISGGTVVAVGGLGGGAGIGSGFGVSTVRKITVSGDADVSAAGGDSISQFGYTRGEGAAIGSGGKQKSTENYEGTEINGVEAEDNKLHTEDLNCNGSITYYEAGTTAAEIQDTENPAQPTKTVCGHKAGTPQRENEKPATCTEDGGYDLVTYCTECNEKLPTEHVKTDSAMGHALVHHEAQAATCTEVGWEAYDTCENCNYSTYKEIKAKGHALVHHEAKSATCTEVGWEAFDTSENCDYST